MIYGTPIVARNEEGNDVHGWWRCDCDVDCHCGAADRKVKKIHIPRDKQCARCGSLNPSTILKASSPLTEGQRE